MKVLVVVDMQRDFIDGTLGTAEAQAIVDKVAHKIEQCGQSGYEIIFTQDTHSERYLDTQEGKNLPVVHCVRGEQGWQLAEDLQRYVTNETKVYEKTTFGSARLGQDLQKAAEQLEEVQLIGLCTDICVISNAMLIKAFVPEVPVIVDASCCAGVTPESHENALRAMEMCQIKVL